MFVVVKDFDYESFESVIGPFPSREAAEKFVKDQQPTHWNYNVTELLDPYLIHL